MEAEVFEPLSSENLVLGKCRCVTQMIHCACQVVLALSNFSYLSDAPVIV
jgi:hypothetical protein